jgi:hypothetical protein
LPAFLLAITLIFLVLAAQFNSFRDPFIILLGSVPLALFGSAGYGEVLGLISTPYLVLTAVAPALLALVVEAWGYLGAGLALFAVGLVAGLAIEAMTLWYESLAARTAA